MNDRRDPHDDLVDDFFAQHRDAIEPAPASDLGWQPIVRQSRLEPVKKAGRAWRGLVAASVAAVLVVFGVWTWKQEPLTSQDVRPGQAVAQSEQRSDSGTKPSSDAGAAQLPQGVPASFRTWSVSNAGSGTIYNLGSSECGSDVCPTLLRSGADGSSWQAVHTFRGTDTSSATGSDIPAIQPDGALSHVRFVDSQVGYVYGGDLWVTTDRGASFTRVNHAGQTVLDLEIWEGQIYLLTADGCVQGACAGPLYASFTDRSNANGFTSIDSAAVSTAVDDASLVVKDSVVIVQTSKNGRPAQQPWSLLGDKLKPVTGPKVCGRNLVEAVTITASTDAQLVALCRMDQDPSSFRVLTSKDEGRTWAEQSSGALQLPQIGQITLGAADSQHLVATVGGPRRGLVATGEESAGSLQISQDGGRTWAVPKVPESMPVSGFDWNGSPGGAEFYAVPRTTPGFWASTDFGRSWRVVVPSS